MDISAEAERDVPPAPNQMCGVLIHDKVCAQHPLIQRQRKLDENEVNQNSKCTMDWGTCASEAYCRRWGVPRPECDIHNQSWLAKVGFRQIQQPHSGLDCWSLLCLNINGRPGNTLQSKLECTNEYQSRAPVCNSLGCRSKVFRNE